MWELTSSIVDYVWCLATSSIVFDITTNPLTSGQKLTQYYKNIYIYQDLAFYRFDSTAEPN